MKTEGAADIVRVVAVWQAAPGAEDQVRDILRELAATTEREEGCMSFAVLEAAGRAGQFVLIEEYAGERGRIRHLESTHFRRLVLDRAVPLLTHRQVDIYQTVHQGCLLSERTIV